jgi:hypothetical protein
MAGTQPELVSEKKKLHAETGGLGDWIAPIIAFVAVAAMFLTLGFRECSSPCGEENLHCRNPASAAAEE